MRYLAIALIVLALLVGTMLNDLGLLKVKGSEGWGDCAGLALVYAGFALWRRDDG